MSRSHLLRHVFRAPLPRSPITLAHSGPCLRRPIHQSPAPRFLKRRPPPPGYKYEEDSHNPKEYALFAAIMLSIVGYGYYQHVHRDPSDAPTSQTPLNPKTFVPFLLAAKEELSPTSAIYTLRRSSSRNKTPYAHLFDLGAENNEPKVCSIEFRQPQLQIARAYTPLPPVEGSEGSDLRFLIRRERGGEVSNYLDGLRVGATIDLRGPWVEWKGQGVPDEIVILAGGTGIAPAMQVIRACLGEGDKPEIPRPGYRPASEKKDKRRRPKVRVLWANRRREDCEGATKAAGASWLWSSSKPAAKTEVASNKIVAELEQMVQQYGGDLRIEYLVDEEKTFIDRRRIKQSISATSGSSQATTSPAKLLFVSGPEGFVDYIAGPRTIESGVQGQGPVKGVLGSMRLKEWTVVKL